MDRKTKALLRKEVETAEAMWHAGEYEGAFEAYRRYIGLGGNDPGVIEDAFVICLLAERPNDARDTLDQLVHLDCLEPEELLLHKGELAALEGHHLEAIDLFQKSLDIDSSDTRAIAGLADSLDEVGQLDGAIQTLREGIRYAPDDSYLHRALASRLNDKGDFEESISEYEKAIQLDDACESPQLRIVRLLMKLKRYGEAEAILKSYIRENPEDAEAYSDLGDLAKALGNEEGALDQYKRAAELDPLEPEYLNAIEGQLTELDRWEEAEAILVSAVTKFPENGMLHRNLAGVHWHFDRLDEAQESFKNAIAAEPQFVSAYWGLADLLIDRGRYDEAETYLSMALELEPSDDLSHLYESMGDLESGRGNDEQAVKHYRKAFETTSGGASLHKGLGGSLLVLRQLAEAEEVLRRGLAIEPQHAGLNADLGNVFWHQQRYEESAYWLSIAHQLDPHDEAIEKDWKDAVQKTQSDQS